MLLELERIRMTIKSLGIGTLLVVLSLPLLGAGCQPAYAQDGAEAMNARRNKKPADATTQLRIAHQLATELRANFGKEGTEALKRAKSRPQLVRYLKKAAKSCKKPCAAISYFAKASGTARAQLKFDTIKGKHYGRAILQAAEEWDYQAQDGGDGDGGTPPAGDDSGTPPAGDDSGTPPDGDDGGTPPDGDDTGKPPGGDGGTTPPDDDDSSPFECLSWWGEHIGSSDDDNGGLPRTSFPPANVIGG